MSNFDKLRELVFEQDNTHCFIERERILKKIESEKPDVEAPDVFAKGLSRLLSEVSVPVYECDYFAGRIVEAAPDEGFVEESHFLISHGHLSPDYRLILAEGFGGMLKKIKAKAAEKGDADSISFAENAETVIMAVKAYCERYAAEARKMGKTEMANALMKVPFEPAYDFYSALQAIWIIHMIAGGYVGARDFAFGRFDQYMLPYYEKSLANGESEEHLTELLAGFMIKCNEICGRTTHNYKCKPILSQASKQYVCIGGETPNAVSRAVLKAAQIYNMAQPQITVLLAPEADEAFTNDVFGALSTLVDKIHVYNYHQTKNYLIKKGISEDIAKDYTYSACCTFDLHYHTDRQEYYTPVPQIFVKTLHKKDYTSLEELCTEFKNGIRDDMQSMANKKMEGTHGRILRRFYVFDGLLLSDSALDCHYHNDGTAPYNCLQFFCPGIATLGDSLRVIDKLVFKEKRYTYAELMKILDDNWAGYEELRAEVLSYTRFGNDDDEVDKYATLAGNVCMDAADEVKLKPNYILVSGFYSLERDNTWREEIGATPDGRLAGDAFSENQSPTYGADKNGITALLKSIAKLPFERTGMGGLNLTFSKAQKPETLKALTFSYFALGGFHIGTSVVDREVLCDAMKSPERYKSLTVRLYGFSEYFVSLPEWQQLAVLNRTEYNG